MERNARVLVVDVPALDQDAFGVQLRIELDQTVPDGIDRALAVEEVAVEGWQVAEIALAQDPAAARLYFSRWRGRLGSSVRAWQWGAGRCCTRRGQLAGCQER